MSGVTSESRMIHETPATRWNDTILAHGGHVLQSWEWGAFKQRHGWQPERISVSLPEGEGHAQVLFRRKGPISLGYLPRGPILLGNVERVWPGLLREIDAVAKRHRAMSVIIEPNQPLALSGSYYDAGVVAGPAHLQPGRTVKVPLADDDAMLKQMHQKTRYNVRLAMRRGVEIERRNADEGSLRQYYSLMLDTAERNEFVIHSYEYYADFVHAFGERSQLFFALADGNIASVLIAAAFGTEAIYMYGASSTEHRAHGAAFLLQFEAMRWARERGCTTYDLWGIPEQDPDSLRSEDNVRIAGSKGSDWRGLYRFKTGFGGDIIEFPPTIERRYVPVLPWLARRLGVIQE
jgi:peptidoglycan pentaglycine glycine transferase (the first glycine)